jgi:hypothetical protein
LHLLFKVEHGGAIPGAGTENPENERLSMTTHAPATSQVEEDERLMRLEMALVRALRQLAAGPGPDE